MARIVNTQKFKIEDFPSQREWIQPLFQTLNGFILDSVGAINKGLKFVDNFLGAEKEFTFTYTGGTLPLIFSWSLADRPQEVVVTSAFENPDPINRPNFYRPIGASIAWEFGAQGILIQDILKQVTYRGSTISGSTTVSNLTSSAGIMVTASTTQSISGTGIPSSSYIVSNTSTTLVLSAAATATGDDIYLNIGGNTASISSLESGFGYKIRVRAKP